MRDRKKLLWDQHASREIAQGIMVVLELEGHHSIALEWDCQEGALTMVNWHLSVSSLSMAYRDASAIEELSFTS